MLRKVHLYGHLKDSFGQLHELDVETAGEAIRALSSNFPTFLDALQIGSYAVIRGDYETGLELDVDSVNTFKLGKGDLHIVPVIAGSGGGNRVGGFAKIILGIALIGASIFTAGGIGMLATTQIAGGALMGMTYGNLAMIGAGLAIAGVASLLSSPEQTEKKDESFTLNGPASAYEQGSPVPIVYGEVITGGVAISGGIDIENIGAYQG